MFSLVLFIIDHVVVSNNGSHNLMLFLKICSLASLALFDLLAQTQIVFVVVPPLLFVHLSCGRAERSRQSPKDKRGKN
jgi:hypothetical protein